MGVGLLLLYTLGCAFSRVQPGTVHVYLAIHIVSILLLFNQFRPRSDGSYNGPLISVKTVENYNGMFAIAPWNCPKLHQIQHILYFCFITVCTIVTCLSRFVLEDKDKTLLYEMMACSYNALTSLIRFPVHVCVYVMPKDH